VVGGPSLPGATAVFGLERRAVANQVWQQAHGQRTTAHQPEVAVHGVKRCGLVARLGLKID
jgi:hypothetical protein